MDFKKDFPIFTHRPDLVYLDNAATTQKPQAVLSALTDYYSRFNSNIHRGPNFLAEEATIAYENARRTVADFIHAENPHEVIFTRNATESINLVAHSVGDLLQEGDEILLTKLEHHSNIVPWLQLKESKKIRVNFMDIDANGFIEFDPSQITKKTRVVAITAMSNSFGFLPDLGPIINAAKAVNALVLVDAAQFVVHESLNVKMLGADFVVFSGHKLYGPTGIGVLWGREDVLQKLPPFLGGGDMINEVFTTHYTPADLPNKFEAGTPNIAGAIGLKAAIEYLEKIGYENLKKHEADLTSYALGKLENLPFVTLLGPPSTKNRGPVISFGLTGVHPHDIAEGLSQNNICIRAGHHCTQVLMDQLDLPGTARLSMALYNTPGDIDKTIDTLQEVYDYFH